VYALITAFQAPQPAAQTVRETPHAVASPEPSATATAIPTPKETVLKTGAPSLPVNLTVIENGAIVNNQVVGGQVIINGPAYGYTDQMVEASSGIVDTPNGPKMIAKPKGEVLPRNLAAIACWTGGGLPGSNPDNTPPRQTPSDPKQPVAPRFTSYCYGHSWINDAVFNLLRTLTPGTNVILQVTTENGYIYAYQLTDSFHVRKGLLGNDPRVTDDVVNRMVTVSCYRPDGYPAGNATVDNIVGIWKMTTVLDRPWSAKIGVKIPHGAAHVE
jgi:hypothetical protein